MAAMATVENSGAGQDAGVKSDSSPSGVLSSELLAVGFDMIGTSFTEDILKTLKPSAPKTNTRKSLYILSGCPTDRTLLNLINQGKIWNYLKQLWLLAGNRKTSKTTLIPDGGALQQSPDDFDGDLAVALARVSSREQADNGASLKLQAERAKMLADKRGLKLVGGVVREEGKSGQTLDRDGINEIIERVEAHNIKYLIVYNISRIGRTALETVHFLLTLRLRYGVAVLTPDGVADVKKTQDLLVQVVKAFSAENEVQNKSEAATRSKISNFLDGSWGTAFRHVPPGYEWDSSREWIQVNEREARNVREAYNYFLQTASEGESEEAERTYGDIVDRYGDELGGLDTKDVKEMLSRPIYIGKPTFGGPAPYLPPDQAKDPEENLKGDLTDPATRLSRGVVKPDPDLKIVSEEKFREVRSKVRIKEARKSGSDDVTDDIESLLERFGVSVVVDASKWVRVVCRNCNSEMMKNGTEELKNRTVRQWLCSGCGKTVLFPKEDAAEYMTKNQEDGGGDLWGENEE
jgi:DNA invertase Pin-like site-specific DNA recombinase/RNase P subunit RPR2